MHLGNSFLYLSLMGQHPTALQGPLRQPMRKPLFGRMSNSFLGTLADCLHLAAAPIHMAGATQSPTKTEWMRQLPGPGQYLARMLLAQVRKT